MKLLILYNEKETQQLKKRIEELERKSYLNNIYTYTGFLSMSEQDVFYKMSGQIKGSAYQMYGGSSECERQMLRFGSEETLGYEEPFPIVCLCIKPLLEKFADNFSHRDFLGAIMNLGIDRSTVGDIFLQGKLAYVFCTDKMAPFITENLDKVKHTNVKCILTEPGELIVRETETVNVTVSSERADAIISKLYNISRNESLALFREKKIYINGRLSENNSCSLKDRDVVSVRGYGKFIYQGMCRETKKGKISVSAGIYR